MKSTRRRIEQKLGSFAFLRLQKWASRQKEAKAYRWGARAGRLVFRLSKKHRLRALNNLRLAYPEMTEDDRIDLAKRVFQHFGETAVDFMRALDRTNENVLETATYEGLEYLDEALKLGKGVLIITGHLGNWERAAHWTSARGYKMSVVARDANQSDLNDLVLQTRKAAGVEVIARGNAVRPILHKLKKNEIVAILPDQNSAESFIPFFGKPAGTVQGPAVLHIRTGAPLIPMACYANGPGKMHMVFRPPVQPLEGYEDPVDALMASVNLELEKLIRVHPEQYLWFHDRWKSARRQGLV